MNEQGQEGGQAEEAAPLTGHSPLSNRIGHV